jgi:hypothetical protein
MVSAQDVFFVSYYSGANTEGNQDGLIRLTNPGVDDGNDLCADIYVFDNTEQLLECCGCTLTPNDLRSLSINGNLTRNPANGQRLTTGVLKIVSAKPNPNSRGQCDPTGGATLRGFKDNIVPTPDIRAWATHIQNPFSEGGAVATEEEFADAPLSADELATLQHKCFGIQTLGSGRGICTCGIGF